MVRDNSQINKLFLLRSHLNIQYFNITESIGDRWPQTRSHNSNPCLEGISISPGGSPHQSADQEHCARGQLCNDQTHMKMIWLHSCDFFYCFKTNKSGFLFEIGFSRRQAGGGTKRISTRAEKWTNLFWTLISASWKNRLLLDKLGCPNPLRRWDKGQR